MPQVYVPRDFEPRAEAANAPSSQGSCDTCETKDGPIAVEVVLALVSVISNETLRLSQLSWPLIPKGILLYKSNRCKPIQSDHG